MSHVQMNLTQFSGTVYPNKKISIGVVPRKKQAAEDSRYERERVNQPEVNYGNVSDWLESKLNIGGKFQSLSENPDRTKNVLVPRDISEHDLQVLHNMDNVKNRDFSAFYDVLPPSEAPLLVKSPQSSRKSTSSYGKNGITLYGRRVLENTALLLQRRYGRRCLGFGTTTLPDMDKDTLKYLLANWGDVVRRFFQKLARITARVGCPFIYSGCTEIQPKRFEDTRLPVPHLHFVYVAKFRVSDGYLLYADEDYTAWNEAVNEVLARGGFLPLMGVCGHVGSFHIKSVRKSAAAYVGKYISKGAKEVKAMQEEGYEDFPRQWWFACMQCKKMFKDSLIKLSQDICAMIFYDAESLIESDFLTYMQSVWVDYGGRQYRCGLTGTLGYDAYRYIKEVHK